MGTWAVAGVATVIFMSLYSSEDFATRLNFKIAPHIEFRIIAVMGIVVNFIFCYVWEVRDDKLRLIKQSYFIQIYFLDCLLFEKVLPIYKVML